MVIFWFRRDLRLSDNRGLFEALMSGKKVLPIFIFDEHILSKLESKEDKRVSFLYKQVLSLKKQLNELNSDLLILHGSPLIIIKNLIKSQEAQGIYTNEDYEPYALTRDTSVNQLCKNLGVPFFKFKDHVIFAKNDILKPDGKPYTVFTPYSKKWKLFLTENELRFYDISPLLSQFFTSTSSKVPLIEEIGFRFSQSDFPSQHVPSLLFQQYGDLRDYPSKNGTSMLGIHLRFGTISVRQLAKKVKDISPVFLNELIWRDFYQMILWHFPHVQNRAFKPQYDKISWLNDEQMFNSWCEGKTGYPIVDAGMRQLVKTGFMHNRVRMIVASFLCKHLLIHWSWGEHFFAHHLLDFDLASNNGGWQWASGSGCDAAPYFRVFNPTLQTQKFDPNFEYIKKWVPEYTELSYPKPIVDHKFARERAISSYKFGLAMS